MNEFMSFCHAFIRFSLKKIKNIYEIYAARWKSLQSCNYYYTHRFFEFRKWINERSDVAADAWIRSISQSEAELIYLRFVFSAEFLNPAMSLMHWFEKRHYAAHLAHERILELKNHYSRSISTDTLDIAMIELFREWQFSQNKKQQFVRSCNRHRKRLSDYLNSHFHDTHMTMQFFKSASYFDIDSTRNKPEQVREAQAGIPWGYRHSAGDGQRQRQLQQQWTEYRNREIIQGEEKQDGDDVELDAFNNGERVLNYWEDNLQRWPLLALIAIRTVKVVISTADVERVFSKWNHYMSRYDATSLSPDTKIAKAHLIQNKEYS